jgi:hypothetical protein
MKPDESRDLLAKLKIHFPTFLPADERLATVAAEDWLKVLAPCPVDLADRALTKILTSWHAKDGAPKIGDWNDLVQPMMTSRARSMIGSALEAGPEPQSVRDRRLAEVRRIKTEMGWTS